MYSIFSINSEANASELLENHEYMFPRYMEIDTYVIGTKIFEHTPLCDPCSKDE